MSIVLIIVVISHIAISMGLMYLLKKYRGKQNSKGYLFLIFISAFIIPPSLWFNRKENNK